LHDTEGWASCLPRLVSIKQAVIAEATYKPYALLPGRIDGSIGPPRRGKDRGDLLESVEPGNVAEAGDDDSRRARAVGLSLLLAAVIASLTVFPYTYAIERRSAAREQSTGELILMTFLVWLGTRMARWTTPASAIVWMANVPAAILFGALHLPQAFVLVGINTTLVAFTLLGNGVPGAVFGWLYWRRGLVATMVSHFAADLLLKGVLPLLGLA
jgi:hypothetical protein